MSGAFLSGTAISLLGTTGACTAGVVAGAKSILEGDYAVGATLLGVFGGVGAMALRNYMSRFEESQPNEWMLVIEDGEQKRASVGLQHFRTMMQTVVRFPSTMQNVSFQAEQVTKEVQGVRVKGFATWTVFRNDDGPYRAYRTFDGLSENGRKMANNQLGSLVESILRNMVSNLTINEVLTQRDSLRKNSREQLIEITKGWGIWIETVEITDVRISSGSLFANLQAEFRQKTRLEAEHIKMKADKELRDAQRANEVATQEAKQKADTRKYEIEQQESLNRQQRLFETKKEQHKIRLQEMEQSKEYSLNQTKTNNEINEASTKASQALSSLKKDFEIATQAKSKEHEREMRRLDLELQNTLTPTDLKLRMMDILDKAVGRVNYDMKVVNMGNNDALSNMIPGMAQLWKETMQN